MVGSNFPFICSRYYIRDAKGKLQNTPYVDNSYKWAGGGFLSTVKDLTKVGNIMLYCYRNEEETDHSKSMFCMNFRSRSHCSLFI